MEQENLHSLREQVARQASSAARERSLKSQLPALKAREEELAAARSKEQTDVDKLEGGSLKAYFLRFTGGLEDRLDQERAEAAQAAVRHNMVCRELASVQADLESAQAELASLAGCEERYRAALEERPAAPGCRWPHGRASAGIGGPDERPHRAAAGAAGGPGGGRDRPGHRG